MLVFPSNAAIKLLTRSARYAKSVHNSMPDLIVGREKTMITMAAAEVMMENEDKYPSIPLD